MAKMIFNKLVSYGDKCKHDNIGAYAAQAAFFIIMSAIPFMMVFSSLLQYTPISQEKAMEMMYEIMPNYIQPFFGGLLLEVYSRSFGLISIAAIVALWSAGKALQYMATGFNVLHGLKETRNWLVVRLWSVLYTLVLIFSIALILVLMVFHQHLQELLRHAMSQYWHVNAIFSLGPLVRGLVVLGILCCLFIAFFCVLPNKKVSILEQIPGAVVCAVVWYIFSLFLSLYVNNFNGFSMYGSMSTLVLLMFWLYSCMYIMFMCAEANVVFAEQIAAIFHRRRVAKGKKS